MGSITRFLYQFARASNAVRIAERTAGGHPETFVKHVRNKVYFRLFGRFLR